MFKGGGFLRALRIIRCSSYSYRCALCYAQCYLYVRRRLFGLFLSFLDIFFTSVASKSLVVRTLFLACKLMPVPHSFDGTRYLRRPHVHVFY